MKALDLYCGATHGIDADARQSVTPTFAEFFCGAGLARLGLGPRWRCVLANDNDPKKARAYLLNFGLAVPLRVCDIADLSTADVPGVVDVAWASPPCISFSAAGKRQGLDDRKHGRAFLDFLRQVEALACEGRALRVVVVENVPRLMTSNGGADIGRVLSSLEGAEYDCTTAMTRRASCRSRGRAFSSSPFSEALASMSRPSSRKRSSACRSAAR